MEEVNGGQGSERKTKTDERGYENQNQRVLVRVVRYLAEDVLTPKGMKEISEALDISRDVAFRTLWNLKNEGWAEETANGYRLAPAITQIAEMTRRAIADAHVKYLGT